jgi:hypothetical protein
VSQVANEDVALKERLGVLEHGWQRYLVPVLNAPIRLCAQQPSLGEEAFGIAPQR